MKEKCFQFKFSQVPHAVSQCETRPCTGIGGLSVAALMLYLTFRFEVYRMLISIVIGFKLLVFFVYMSGH